MSQERPQWSGYQDVKLYIALVSKGRIYEYLQDKMRLNSRGEAKKLFFSIVFGNPKATYGKHEREMFQKLFPTVFQVFVLIKSVKYQDLAILLQTIESTQSCWILFVKGKPKRKELPIYTIHDSILTLDSEKESVGSIMKGEIKNAIGFEPAIEFE